MQEELKRLISENKVIPFVGAGISKDVKNKDGKKLIVSHSCINNYIDENLNLVMSEFLQEDEFDVIQNIIWNRDLLIKNQNHIKELKNYFNVFGHTITDEPIINNKFAAIETGVANKNGGKLTCLAYPSMKIYQN